METYFASAERTGPDTLKKEISIINNSPVMSTLLSTVGGLLAIVDTNRQLVAINYSMLELLGVPDPSEALGLRPGEVLQCPHSTEEPGGCGTSRSCRSCGAVIAMTASMECNEPVENKCQLRATIQGTIANLVLNVRSHPVDVDEQTFLLLFIQDITDAENKAALERSFFHDISNSIFSLMGTTELLAMTHGQNHLIETVRQAALQLKKEIEMQRCISESKTSSYSPEHQLTTTGWIQDQLMAFFENHAVRAGKTIECSINQTDCCFTTDTSLLMRILSNMTTNALEATTPELPVKIWAQETPQNIAFHVHNEQPIPEDVALHIFKHHFSTKGGAGRGIGTFSMKLFGEKVLKGHVSFTTSEAEGTTFRISLPTVPNL